MEVLGVGTTPRCVHMIDHHETIRLQICKCPYHFHAKMPVVRVSTLHPGQPFLDTIGNNFALAMRLARYLIDAIDDQDVVGGWRVLVAKEWIFLIVSMHTGPNDDLGAVPVDLNTCFVGMIMRATHVPHSKVSSNCLVGAVPFFAKRRVAPFDENRVSFFGRASSLATGRNPFKFAQGHRVRNDSTSGFDQAHQLRLSIDIRRVPKLDECQVGLDKPANNAERPLRGFAQARVISSE